jgi:hypothetical protein
MALDLLVSGFREGQFSPIKVAQGWLATDIFFHRLLFSDAASASSAAGATMRSAVDFRFWLDGWVVPVVCEVCRTLTIFPPIC